MRTVLYVIIAALLLGGCKSSGESDLERQLSPPDDPGTPGECKSARAVEARDETSDFYHANVYPIMQSDCMDCHVSGGEAGSTAYVLSGDANGDYALVSEFTEREIAGYPYLVAKATALAGHTGGQRFSLSSEQAQVLIGFAELMKGGTPSDPPDDCPVPGDGEFFSGVTLASNEETLGKAAMLMLGRRPTAGELAAVGDGSLTALQATLRDMMTGPDFTRFVMVAANDQLLTNRFAARGEPLINEASELSYYRFSALNYPGIMPMPDYQTDFIYNEALTSEPLALIAYIITNERDYREVLTAPYTVFNSLTYEFFDHEQDGYVILRDPTSGELLPPPSGPDDWVPGTFAPGVGTGYYRSHDGANGVAPDVRLSYPHAGVLTTLPWLGRWQSTETNRNRKRAKMALRQFLGYDIELTASRPMNADALNDPDNPTYKNPACTSCHYQLDALAGTFQNWGFTGRFRLNHEFFNAGREYPRADALNDGYKADTADRCGMPDGDGGYCTNDLWYADTFPAGFVFQGDSTVTEMPNDGAGREGPHDDASLRWVAAQLVADARFATGTARFWYEAVFNEKPLNAPVEGDPNYEGKFLAYVAQQQLFDDVAAVFARDNGHGVYNAKDVLVALFSSSWFRATAAQDAETRRVQLANVGMGALLTPEQLERKVRSLLGIDWQVEDQYFAVRQALTYTFNVMYGGIDSDTVTVRTRQVNPLMISVAKRMVSEISCEAVYLEFIADRGDLENFDDPMRLNPPELRHLFDGYNGETPEDAVAIKQVLAKLHRELWNEQADAGSAEVQHSFDLFSEFWEYEQGSGESMHCESNRWKEVVPLESGDPVMPPEAMRVWRDMLTYFILDFKFLHE